MIRVTAGKGNNIAISKIHATIKDFVDGIQEALHNIGPLVNKETARLIKTGPKTGRMYYYRGSKYQASAPWEAPANRSGRLLESQAYKVQSEAQLVVGETAVSKRGAPYPLYLEGGTTKMVPRPHLGKAVDSLGRTARNELLVCVWRRISR